MRHELNVVNEGDTEAWPAPPSGGAFVRSHHYAPCGAHACAYIRSSICASHPVGCPFWWLCWSQLFSSPLLSQCVPCVMSSSGSTPTTRTPPTSASASTEGTLVTLSREDLRTIIQTAVHQELSAVSSASSSFAPPPSPIPSLAAPGVLTPVCCQG